jgi:hypothetical protein
LKRRFLLQAALALLLLLVVVLQAGRLLSLWGGWTIDLGNNPEQTLSPATVAFCRSLDQPLAITYFGTLNERQPAHLKGVEGTLRTLLAAIEREAPGKVQWRVVDPGLSGTAGAEYAARHRVAPVKVRRVVRDETSEQAVWSSLVLALGDYHEVVIQDVEPSALPHLQGLIVADLKALQTPPRPVFGVAAPDGYDALHGILANSGEVLDLDLNRQSAIPPEVDVLFWVEPSTVTPAYSEAIPRSDA